MSTEPRIQQEHDMFLIRENRSGEYVRLITPTVIHTAVNGKDAIHYRSREAADAQCTVLRQHGPVECGYQVILAMASAVV